MNIVVKSQGFTLIEILVSLVILAIGLLGLGALQLLAIKNNQNAYYYSQATALAYDMVDRMHANSVKWQENTLPIAAVDCSNNCNGPIKPCNPSELASHDLCIWKGNATAQLGSSASANILISPVVGSQICTGSAVMRCLQLSWKDQQQGDVKFELELLP